MPEKRFTVGEWSDIIQGSEERTAEECEVGDSRLAGPMLCYLMIGERVSLTAAPWTTAASWGRYWMPDFAKIRICFHYRAGTPLTSYLAFGSDRQFATKMLGCDKIQFPDNSLFWTVLTWLRLLRKARNPAGFNCSDIRTAFREREGKREERNLKYVWNGVCWKHFSGTVWSRPGLKIVSLALVCGEMFAWNLRCPPLTYKYWLKDIVFVLFGLLLTAHVQYHNFGCS